MDLDQNIEKALEYKSKMRPNAPELFVHITDNGHIVEVRKGNLHHIEGRIIKIDDQNRIELM